MFTENANSTISGNHTWELFGDITIKTSGNQFGYKNTNQDNLIHEFRITYCNKDTIRIGIFLNKHKSTQKESLQKASSDAELSRWINYGADGIRGIFMYQCDKYTLNDIIYELKTVFRILNDVEFIPKTVINGFIELIKGTTLI